MTQTEDSSTILDLLRRRLEQMKDLPAMSNTLRILNKKASLDATVSELTDTILQDFGLTNKLLRMVNSVYYIKTQFAGKINTISRAIYVLGMDHVRNAALSLILFDNMKNKALADELKNMLSVRFFCGVIAREVARASNMDEMEEAFLCAMFYNLGEVLIAYYLPGERKKIRELIEEKKINERTAVQSLLGMSYEAIGISVAKEWSLSNQIVYAMHRLPPTAVPAPELSNDKIRVLANFSNDLCTVIEISAMNPDVWETALKLLIGRYWSCFHLSEDKIKEILHLSLKGYNDYAAELRVSRTPFVEKIDTLLGITSTDQGKGKDSQVKKDGGYLKLGGLHLLELDLQEEDGDKSPEAVFTRGIQDIATSLLDDYSINDILRMVLEVMYRAMEFANVLILIYNTRSQTMEARFGFGRDTAAILRNFKVAIDKSSKDVFNSCIAQGSDLLIKDINDPAIAACIPNWFSLLMKTETFILLPVVVERKTIALIYADKTAAGKLEIIPQHLRSLKTLRNQAVLAIKQKQKHS